MRTVTGVVMAGSVIVLVACGTGSQAPREPVQPNSAQPENPIPLVQNPRDITAIARQPCESLTTQQAREFGLDIPPRQYDAALGDVGCEWTTTTRERETIRTVSISTFTDNPTLEVAYSKRAGLPFFELTQIAGYPTIVARTNEKIPICDIDIKPAERQSFSLTYHSEELRDNPQQSCEVGKQVAAAVLMNLPPKS